MRRFILQANVTHFQKLLDRADDESVAIIRRLLNTAQRELAQLEASEFGAGRREPARPVRAERDDPAIDEIRARFERSPDALILLDPGPALTMLDVTPSYCVVIGRDRESMVGRPVFELFPDNPDDPMAAGLATYYGSLRAAAESGSSQVMEGLRYDVADPSGHFVERHWRLVNTPVFDATGRLTYLVTEVEEATPPSATAQSA